MVRAKNLKAVAQLPRAEESPTDGSLMVQSRSRRTIKPNPKYSGEMIPLKRLDSGDEDDDDDMDLDGSQNTEDDEDFQDDGARDSDADESPRARRRVGRPPTRPVEAPRSEPQPQRRLQQIRAGLKEATMSTSKIMQKTGIVSTLEKKRKIDFDGDDTPEPNSKRRAGAVAVNPSTPSTPVGTRGGARFTATPGVAIKNAIPTSTLGKENASVLKKSENSNVRLANAQQVKSQATPTSGPVKSSPVAGITTRRQQATTVTSTTTTPSPKAVTGIVRTQAVTGSGGKDATSGSMIQVRRTTPMNSQSSTSPATVGTPVGTSNATQKAPQSKERVILNRTPVAKPRPAVPVVSSAAATTPRTLPSRSPAAGATKGSPSPVAGNKLPAGRVLNSTLGNLSNSVKVGPAAAAASVKTESNPTTSATSLEKRYMLHLAPEEEVPVTPCIADPGKASIPLFQLRNQIRSLKMPTERWSYQMKLHTIRGKPDPTTEVPDKPGYMVHSVILNRLIPSPSTSGAPQLLNGQKVDTRKFDRSVELMKDQYNVIIDGRPVRLLGAPNQVADKEDVETLLQIVDHITIESPILKVAPA